ncbi:response regulator transcription factor [Polaribacter aestuariivivens]|uniref:Response regulator transcription factor n=1 Tax=Polaribacter aestuariivivens TaxID=2304626 RepID=A0A5S3N7T4_9FLAO|nr:response regulator transcription factor [Polaribacter aestuariivivens]TMM31373.1 response regulator transcription factor [Polaribacter aestuariivivens]
MNKPPIKTIIADDNRFFCDALKDSLNIHEEINVAHTFTTLNELIEFTNNNILDVLILDINFNGESSLNFIPEIKSNNKNFKIIALTTMNNNFIKDKAMKSGVDFFVGKDGDLANFKEIILNCFYSDQKKFEKKNSKIKIGNHVFTKRKLEVLQALYIHSDKKEKELSTILNITESSLKSHKRDLFEITNTSSTPELIKFGIQHGLIVA